MRAGLRLAWRGYIRAALALGLSLFALSLDAATAHAEPKAPNTRRRYSPYEIESIRRALARIGGELEPEPEGKIVESIEVVTLDVIEDRDPAPAFLNWFHVTTKPYVIEREVLLPVGDPFSQRLSDETERNLRQLFLFSVVVGLAAKGSAPGRVRYVVVTKDIWSLRASWDGRFNNGVIDYLSFQPTERNLFGAGRQIYGTLIFTANNYTVGAGFVEPRLGGTRLRLSAAANAIVNCATGEIDGSSGSFQYALPLYSVRTPWSYSTTLSWSDRATRLSGTHGASICSAPAQPTVRLRLSSGNSAAVPNEYSADTQSFTQSFTRSFGVLYKTNIGFGLEARRSAYRGASLAHVIGFEPESGQVIELTPAERREAELRYQRLVPQSNTRISPFFQLTSYTTNFHRDINSETLGLQEDLDFRLGPYAILKLYPAFEGLGSTRDLFGIQTTIGYATSVGTGFFKVVASHDVEISQRRDETDAEVSFALRFTSPRLGFGRFVYDARFVDRYRNFFNQNVALDGTNRLRGYATNAAIGASWIASNLEFRTRPVQIFSTQLAAVVFQDIGDAFFEFDELQLKQGVGFGIRFLAPQLDRDVFRFDVGFPMPLDTPGGDVSFVASFGQAFSVP